MFEMVMMSLRMKKGLNRHLFKHFFAIDVYDVYNKIIDEQVNKGNLLMNDDYLYCSERGFMILNEILVEFL